MEKKLNQNEIEEFLISIIDFCDFKGIPVHINFDGPPLKCSKCSFEKTEEYWFYDAKRFQMKAKGRKCFRPSIDGDYVQCPKCKKVLNLDNDLVEID